jgi:hypothetical protein
MKHWPKVHTQFVVKIQRKLKRNSFTERKQVSSGFCTRYYRSRRLARAEIHHSSTYISMKIMGIYTVLEMTSH